METPLKIALCQVNPTVGALEKNASLVERFAARAGEAGADLAVFPELVIAGYPPEDLVLKDHFVDDCMEALNNLIPRLPPDLTCVIGCPWDDSPVDEPSGTPFNAAVIVRGGQIGDVYRKMLLPNYGVFDEKRVFDSGTTPLVLDVKGSAVSIQICEDSWRTDQGPCAELASQKLDAIINLSASPYHRHKLEVRRDVLGRAARHLRCPLLYCNVVGGQDEVVFDGGSLGLDADGAVFAAARQFEEDLLLIELPSGSTAARMEPDLDDHAEVYRALTTGLRDYVDKTGFHRVVIALSGGVDSAMVASLAADALGPGRVVGITMPSQYSSKDTRSDAEELARNLGIEFHEVAIADLFELYQKELGPFFAGRDEDTTEENLQARIRGNLIMAFSNKFGWLVLTTGNKSEVAVGYCTLYGDMVGGFAVIKDVPKTLVWDLCRWRNAQSDSPVIPPSTIDRPPSAELRPDQKDTDSLPPYEVLDGILERYVERDFSLDEIVADGFDPALVQRIIRLTDINEYKRRQAAPGIKITPKAFGRDRRLPITNAYRDHLS